MNKENKLHDLIKNIFTSKEISKDQTFLYADVFEISNKKGTEYRIYIDSKHSKCSMKENKNIPSVVELREAKANKMETPYGNLYKNQLISAGIFLKINDKTVAIKRDDGARIDPNKYQFPAGRCSESPKNTAKKEFDEEVRIEDKRTGERLFLKDLNPTKIEDFNNDKIHIYISILKK